MKLKVEVVILLLILVVLAFGQQTGKENQIKYGRIKGRVVDSASKEPLTGVNVILVDTKLGAATDLKGEYLINIVPVGSYNVEFHYMGYEKVTCPDIIIRPGRITFLNEEMHEAVFEGEQIVVTAGYFRKEEHEPTSITSFNKEEVRRSPGSGGDVSRILTALPSTSQVADYANDLMVRGGSPSENGFYIDNILIPNVNHFPVQGSSGGTIGLINVDFIEDVKFSAGGFPVTHGNRLSSIVDIRFRDGNREEFDMQLDMSMQGFGGIFEGPLPNKKGSWLFSARRSYLDLIIDLFEAGGIPAYSDIHGKITYDINPNNRITILNLFGKSWQDYDGDEAKDAGLNNYGTLKDEQNTIGLNWRCLWSEKGYSNTAFSYSSMKNSNNWISVKTGELKTFDENTESSLRLYNINFYQINKTNKIEFGFEADYFMNRYDYFRNSFINRLGEEIPGLNIDRKIDAFKGALFASYISNLSGRFTATIGVRADYFSNNKETDFSPRFSVKYKINDKVSLNGAAGLFYQSLPLYLISQINQGKNLKNLKAVHYVSGLDVLLSDDTKLTFEVYNKEYSNFPLDPADPFLFIIDEGNSLNGFGRYTEFVSTGKAYSRGVELLIQKKLKQNFYGLISTSFFRAKYKDYTSVWRNRLYDNRYLFNIIGGYRPNNLWEFSARWNFNGGVPYTPFDLEASEAAGEGIIDQTKINKSRMPDYHTLNIRVDRRFFFRKSSIVAYLSIWNLYNRANIEQYYWDEDENRQRSAKQWSLLPIFGIEYEL